MSKRTISEQANQVSLLGELKKEFAAYVQMVSGKRDRFLKKYPRQVFIVMLCSILFSGVLAFTAMRVKKPEALPSILPATGSVTRGFGEILQSGQMLNEVLELQNRIKKVLHKDSLSAADSLLVKNAIIRLEAIHRKLNNKPPIR